MFSLLLTARGEQPLPLPRNHTWWPGTKKANLTQHCRTCQGLWLRPRALCFPNRATGCHSQRTRCLGPTGVLRQQDTESSTHRLTLGPSSGLPNQDRKAGPGNMHCDDTHHHHHHPGWLWGSQPRTRLLWKLGQSSLLRLSVRKWDQTVVDSSFLPRASSQGRPGDWLWGDSVPALQGAAGPTWGASLKRRCPSSIHRLWFGVEGLNPARKCKQGQTRTWIWKLMVRQATEKPSLGRLRVRHEGRLCTAPAVGHTSDSCWHHSHSTQPYRGAGGPVPSSQMRTVKRMVQWNALAQSPVASKSRGRDSNPGSMCSFHCHPLLKPTSMHHTERCLWPFSLLCYSSLTISDKAWHPSLQINC